MKNNGFLFATLDQFGFYSLRSKKIYLNTNINWSRSLLLVSSNGFFKASEHIKQRKLLKMKKWSSQWTQFMQLAKEAWNFISAVHIWFISYIINTHFFHENMWTHNWTAPSVSSFIAQLVEHRNGIARSRVQTLLKSWIFFRLLYAIA